MPPDNEPTHPNSGPLEEGAKQDGTSTTTLALEGNAQLTSEYILARVNTIRLNGFKRLRADRSSCNLRMYQRDPNFNKVKKIFGVLDRANGWIEVPQLRCHHFVMALISTYFRDEFKIDTSQYYQQIDILNPKNIQFMERVVDFAYDGNPSTILKEMSTFSGAIGYLRVGRIYGVDVLYDAALVSVKEHLEQQTNTLRTEDGLKALSKAYSAICSKDCGNLKPFGVKMARMLNMNDLVNLGSRSWMSDQMKAALPEILRELKVSSN